ncbi:MAG: serine hydrolase domain-containing protein [Gemmatimonadota bacterium]
MFHRHLSFPASAAVAAIAANAAVALLPLPASTPAAVQTLHSAQEATEVPAPPGPTDPSELEAFVDGLMGAALEENNTAGGVVAVVSGGELFFAKGYGYSDWEARIPVDPETTLFRIGSVSKLFVWTSVMQMVEAGLLDLDTDVNEYLDFEIPATFQEPVTLAAIMAHAGGFEDYVIELFGNEPEDVRPLGELVARQLPARVRPSGDLSSYSNHATGIAAYIVERASGIEWKQYVDERILGPLGMEHTSFLQPLPEGLEPDMSKGYSYRGNRFREEDFEYVPLAPVGAGASSAVDMGRFMIAHLQLGRLGDERILSEETARLMQSVHHRMDPSVNGMAHGFAELSQNGEHIIGHGGDTRFFHTGLWLFPEHDLGVYVSFNSGGGGGARSLFIKGFMDRYFPVDEAVVAPPEDSLEASSGRAKRFTGEFRPNRFSHTTFTKLAAVETQSVSVTDRGTLRALSTEWIPVGPLTFQEEFGTRALVFRENEKGQITEFFVSTSPYSAFEKVPLREHPGLHLPIAIFAGLAILLTLLSPFIGWAVRRWFRVPAGELVRISRGARYTIWLAALLFAVGTCLLILNVANEGIAVELLGGLGLIFLIPVLAAVPTLASLLFAVGMWKKGEGRLTVRVFYSLAVVAFCLFLWQLNVWNLLGWNY